MQGNMDGTGSPIKSRLRRAVAALVIVFLLFGPYIADLHRDTSRLWRLWETWDSVRLFGTILGLGLICAGIGELVLLLNRPRLNSLLGHVFVLAFGAGVIANLWYHTDRPHGYRLAQYGVETASLFLLLIGLLGYSMARPGLRLVRRTQMLCLILSPAIVIAAVDCLCKCPCPGRMDPLPVSANDVIPLSAGASNQHPVFVIFFDGWSRRRTFEHGAVRTAFPNLAALAEQSVVFHNAVSPADLTKVSMPRILFGVDWAVIRDVSQFGFERDGRYVPGTQYDSIFKDAAAHGYHTVLIGSALPFQMLLGDQVQTYRTHILPEYARSPNPLAQGGIDLFEAASFWADPWSRFLRAKIGGDWGLYQRTRLGYERAGQDFLDVIERQSGSTFGLIHYPAPHWPYVMDEDGRCCPRNRVIWGASTADLARKGYERNLRCVDWWIGVVMDKLRKRRLFDDAVLILTSDHGWRSDPDTPTGEGEEATEHRDVPLLVKLPGQTAGLAIDERFETRHLREVIRVVLGPDCRPETVRSLAVRLRSSPAEKVASTAIMASK